MSVLRPLLLTVSRLLVVGWVGAAALFVVTSIAEQRSPDLDSTIKDQLVLIRFPYYYQFGFSMVGGGLLTLLLANKQGFKIRGWLAVSCLVAALTAMLVDYFAIYLPLEKMISPPGSTRPAEFMDYHYYSRRINELHATLSLVAAVLLCSANHCRTATINGGGKHKEGAGEPGK